MGIGEGRSDNRVGVQFPRRNYDDMAVGTVAWCED